MNVTQAAESRKGVSPVLATARACLVAGISSLPATEDGEKHPFAPWKQYQKRLPTVDEISTWFSPQRKGIGIIAGKVSGNLEALDFETWEIFLTYEELAHATGHGDLLDRLKGGYLERTPRGVHLIWRCEQIERSKKLAQRIKRDDQGRECCNEQGRPLIETLIETRGEGGFLIIAPSNGTVHPSGKPYVLMSGGIGTIPTITPEQRADLFALARTFNEVTKEKQKERPHQDRKRAGDRPGDLFNDQATWEEVLQGWKKVYERSGMTYWRRPGKDRGVSATTNYQGSDLLYVFSTSTPFESERGYSKFSAYALLTHEGDFKKAAEVLAKAGYKQERSTDSRPSSTQDEPPQFNLTDLGNAERLISRHGQNLRFCNVWGKWLVWSGTRWEVNATQEVNRLARETIRSIYAEAATLASDVANVEDEEGGKKVAEKAQRLFTHATKSEGWHRVRAMTALAEMDCQVLPDELDGDPWLLNVQNGTLNLRTGELQPHRREDLLTKLTPTAYNPDASCPTWEAFLERIFAGRQELIEFIWKAIGYSLTGDTREQCLFLLYGTGANGKSTFLETISALLGDYAEQADFTSFLHKDRDGVRNDLAKLRGARFVSAVEVEEGRRLAEVLVKQLTGCDTITARFLFHEYFNFLPAFKLWLAGNHKPVIRGTDHAIWRRIRLIPFTVTIPQAEQDFELLDKFKVELPGILAWAVRGCLAWQQEGRLIEPEAVKAATEEYRVEMDVIGAFLDERGVFRANITTPANTLYEAYAHWCEHAGEKPLVQKVFGSRLRERGLESGRNSITGRKQWMGIGLTTEES